MTEPLAVPDLLTYAIPVSNTPVFLMMPNAVDNRSVALGRGATRVESDAGVGVFDVSSREPTERWSVQWVCETRAEFQTLRNFWRDRQGRAKAFWLPTWQWELDLYQYLFVGDALWVARAPAGSPLAGYAEAIYPLGPAYRQIVVLFGTRYAIGHVTAVTPNVAALGPTGVDALTWSSFSPSPSVPVFEATGARNDAYRALWLRYVRFDSDTFAPDEQDIDGNGAAVVTLPVITVPEAA